MITDDVKQLSNATGEGEVTGDLLYQKGYAAGYSDAERVTDALRNSYRTAIRIEQERIAARDLVIGHDHLKLRDQKRDAALLREVFDKFYKDKISICALADSRAAGTWEPELEVK